MLVAIVEIETHSVVELRLSGAVEDNEWCNWKETGDSMCDGYGLSRIIFAHIK